MSNMNDIWGSTGVLSFPIDCDAVVAQLNQDMRDDWFVDAIFYRDLLSNKKNLKEVIGDLLLEGNGKYPAGLRNICDIPKKGLGIRYSLETDFYDRFIYQAICTYLIRFYDPLLSPRVLGHRYNRRRKEEKYLFKERIELWQTFEGVTYTAILNKQALLVTDLINYFENISVECIKKAFESGLERVKANGPEKLRIRNAIATLCELLDRWSYSGQHGLPQNRDASSFIANVVLNDVDQKMANMGYDYYRYVDDIRVVCDDSFRAKKALTDLIAELRTVGMNINSGKTKILTGNNSLQDIAEFFPAIDDRSVAIGNMLKSKSRRVIMRSIKYVIELIEDCINRRETQSRQFRFAVNRLIMLIDSEVFNIQSDLSIKLSELIIDTLEDHPASTDQYCRLLDVLEPPPHLLQRIAIYLKDHIKAIHSWQNYHLWFLLSRRKYKSEQLVSIAESRICNVKDSPETAAIFIYLRCVDEAIRLKPLIESFSDTWPYLHQRYFLFATKDFDSVELKPIVNKLGIKIKGTVQRARSHFRADGCPLAERERPNVFNLYDEITPYD